jgi:hypothetical protein
MRIRLAIPDRLVTPAALEAALEATTLANEQAIKRGEVPLIEEAIRKGVKWRPEDFLDGEHFDLAHIVAERGWGDCDDLAPWLSGGLRATGEDPGARSRVYKSGPDRWHVVTETSDGEILDPSKWAGMGRKKSQTCSNGVCGVVARPFARLGEGALCCVPHQGAYWSRVDLPFPNAAGHIASHAAGLTPEASLNRAITGAIACGEEIESPLVDRARLVGAMLIGNARQHPEIGSFFGNLVKSAAKFGTQFIPGVGPIASQALDQGIKMAERAGKKRKQPSAASTPDTVVRALTRGGGKADPTPDTITHAPTGAVSVPISTPSAPPPGEAAPGKPAMIFYHPAGAVGPVVMRF